jgi:two-component system nitrate/nitrite response regulator NarL
VTAPIRVAVIDPHPLYREGVARTLLDIGGFEVVGQGGSREDAFEITDTQSPDIVLVDISMPGGGLSAMEGILDSHPDQKVVVLTVSEASDHIIRAFKIGAKAYVLKDVGSTALVEILRAVASGQKYVSPSLSARLLSDLTFTSDDAGLTAGLTNREREILTLVADGLSNKHVALRLALHEKTVKHHLTRIFAKLNVNNRTEAAIALRDAEGLR